ncbi:DNA polymerase-3 subunit alpha [Natronospira proteinivora]|uniref:DNA polymerase III subunit alpha n=1 Tax=Natronospira proteinivora TaxID=1807133 RepID=A0ABT1G5Q5_9GAMM|nr:DNA polymerase III subunit alpha [Natronospira proteinivora]MCP1726632.1 DNA polymerase-3 subunit alpha [Natronospira proteinivora]
MTPDFVHLRVHTEYSLVDSVVRVGELVDTVAESGMPAVAMTDEVNLFALVKFYTACEAKGVKPIIGADLWIDEPDDRDQPSRITLLCRTNKGYRNLTEIITRAYTEGQHRGRPLVHRDWLDQKSCEGLIALSGGRDGDVGRALLSGRTPQAMEALSFWQARFPESYYLELIRTGREGEEDLLHASVELAANSGTPVVATNDVRFLTEDDFMAHETRVCIQESRTLDDPRRPRRYAPTQYLRTPAEMVELFSDIPEALENTVEIARRCTVEIELGVNYLPDFPIPDGYSAESYLRDESLKGLEERIKAIFPPGTPELESKIKPYYERLDSELEVINSMGFPGYFLVVADFIQWAKDNGVPVGPGRGSGAGSLVAYALKITDLDPLEFDLLFERFLNPERVSMPDFDVDFCMEGRDRVIEYVADKYGREKVSQIITYGSMAARAVVRDVGRVFGHGYSYVDRIAKLIPFEVGMTLERALEEDDELRQNYDEDEEVRTLIDRALSLEGLARNAGKHAGGVVISPSVLTDFTPLYVEPGGGNPVTQLDKDDVEAAGLVKFDFLGLRTLTIIDRAVKIADGQRQREGLEPLDIARLDMNDRPTFELLKGCNTTAVFQLESRGMKDLIRRLQPDTFEDIIALVALFRPGPLQSGMVDDFINRKHGRADVNYPHPDLEPVLEPTYGVILYQEQVMQIAQVLSGYTLGGADILRRAMGKKKMEEMARQRKVFQEGAAERGVDAKTAEYIFDLIEKFAGYGFNKSHSAAYALLSYQTAWLKAHYPAAFMAATLSADMDHTDKIVVLIEDCRNAGLTIHPPDVNHSDHPFTVNEEGQIRYGLGAIKGVGRSAIDVILEERRQGGAYQNLEDLCRRVDLQKVNRRVLEALIRAGALDTLGPNRASLTGALPECLQRADQARRAREAGQNDMFGLAAGPDVSEASEYPPVPELPEWEELDRLAAEKETLGLYLTGHPIRQFEEELEKMVTARIGTLIAAEPDTEGGGYGRRKQRFVTVAGLAVEMKKRGGRMSLVLDDRTGRIEATLFEDTFNRFRHLLSKDALLVIQGRVGFDEFINGWRINVKEVIDMDEAREAALRGLVLRWQPDTVDREFVGRLKRTLEPHREGSCRITVHYINGMAEAKIPLGEEWQVRPTTTLLQQLEKLLGEGHIRRVYRRPSTEVETG